jgi:hypothetical protein
MAGRPGTLVMSRNRRAGAAGCALIIVCWPAASFNHPKSARKMTKLREY